MNAMVSKIELDRSTHNFVFVWPFGTARPSILKLLSEGYHLNIIYIYVYVYVYMYIYICCVVLYITSKVYYYTADSVYNLNRLNS